MRIGYIGVGKWATQLRDAFEARGHETVWHARSDANSLNWVCKPKEGWGPIRRFNTGNMPDYHEQDLIVCTCPPGPLHYYAGLFSGVPMLVTKPFDLERLEEDDLTRYAPTYVDLWRVLTPEWEAFKERFNAIERDGTIGVAIDFKGRGPFRQWVSGAMDHAPHAMAYLLDMFLALVQSKLTWSMSNGLDGMYAEYNVLLGKASAEAGNNSDKKRRGVTVHYYSQDGEEHYLEFGEPNKSAGLAKLVGHCETGNTYTWELNKRVMHELRNVPWVVR